MADEPILSRIEALVQEEHALLANEETDAKDLDALDKDRARLAQLSVELDRCWDLLRQRRARREAGRDPDEAQARDPDVVEKYLQ